jgi:hypothetical protein
MLKIPAENERDTSPAKLTAISSQASLLGVSAHICQRALVDESGTIRRLSHTSCTRRQILHEQFPDRWTCDMTTTFTRFNPVQFLGGGAIKNKVYQEPSITVEEMQQRIIASCGAALLQTLQSTNRSKIQPFRKRIDAKCHHFEQLLLQLLYKHNSFQSKILMHLSLIV